MAVLVVSTLAFLSLLVANQAADPKCEDLTKPLALEDDYSSIMGKWIFAEGIANHVLFKNILNTINSSRIEFAPSSLKDTVILRQWNMLNGKCEFVTINATIKNTTIYVSEKGVSTEGDFLQSSPGCLSISFTSHAQNETIKSIYLFTRSPKASEAETDLYWKQATCLGFKKEPQYSYDGVTEFCKDGDEKDGASADQTKPEDKKEE